LEEFRWLTDELLLRNGLPSQNLVPRRISRPSSGMMFVPGREPCRFRTPQDAASCDALPGLQDFPPPWHHPAPRKARVAKALVPPRYHATRALTITNRSSNPVLTAPAATPTPGPWLQAPRKNFSIPRGPG